MKNINEHLSFEQNINEMKKSSLDKLCRDPHIQLFMKTYHLTREDMNAYWIELLNFHDDYPLCENCKGLAYCKKDFVGHIRKLAYVEDSVVNVVEACDYQKVLEEEEKILSHIHTNLPRRLLNVNQDTIANFNYQLAYSILQYVVDFSNGNRSNKGLFIHGPSQTGKTVCLAFIAKRLAREDVSVAFYNVPALMSQLKSSFNDEEENTSQILFKLKNADYLILDDLGGENFSSWSRDEILGTIIEERLLNQKPTFYSSVYDYDDLVEYYSSSRNKTEIMKVTKLVDKIKVSTNSVDSNA